MTPREKMKAGASALPDDRAGCVLWWSAHLIEADPAAMRATMAKHAPRYLDLVREPVGPHAAMRRAIRRCASGMPEGFVWREVGVDKAAAIAGNGAAANETELVVAYAHETTDIQARTYDAKDEWTLSVNDRTGKVTTSIDSGLLPNDGLVQLNRVLERYRKERLFLTQEDLRGLLLRVFLEDAQGLRLKAQGSVYFIPATPLPMRDAARHAVLENGKTKLRPADEVIDELAPAFKEAGISLLRLPVLRDDTATLQQLAGPAGESILDEIETLRKEAETRIEAIRAGGGKVATLQSRLEDAAALRTKARVYRELLGVGLADAEAALLAAENMIQQAMDDAAKSVGAGAGA